MAKSPKKQGLMSMTGFATIQGNFEDLTWSGDIRSVNGRSLDLRLRLPDVEGLEPEIRKRLQAQLARGNVTVSLRLQREEGTQAANLNVEALAGVLEILKQVDAAASEQGLALAPVTVSDIAAMRGVVELGDTEEADGAALRAEILQSLDAALEAFVSDRQREGSALFQVLNDQIVRIGELVKAATSAAGNRDEAARAALDRNLARLLDATEVPDEARLLQELALAAVKTDVTEELDRLAAHISVAQELLAQSGPVGRKLDFLMQEFNREANTLCSKAQSTELTAVGLDLKTVIDQMREQVQNIE